MTDPKTTINRGILATIFLSPDERRLRAGWRLLVQTILMLLITSIMSFLIFMIDLKFGPLAFLDLFFTFAGGVAIVLSVWVARKWIDHRTFVSLGQKLDGHWWKDLLTGVGISAIIMGLIFLFEWTVGWLSFEGFGGQLTSDKNVFWLEILAFALLFLAVGYYEELMSRGYHLQNLADGLNLGWGVFLSSAVFGLLHLSNPNATWISALGILCAGLFLAYGYLRTQQLWLSIGLHIGWNFFEGPIFGFPVSGIGTPRLLVHTVTGPDWFTGGLFGPEAGLASILAMSIGVGLIWVYTRNRTPKSSIESEASN